MVDTDENVCENVFTIPQFGPTCWFNALLMILFYSELSRNFFIAQLTNLNNEQLKSKQVFYDIVENILFKSYIKDAKSIKRFNSFMKPEKILGAMYNNYKDYFDHDPDKDAGNDGMLYYYYMFNFMNLQNKLLCLEYTKTGLILDINYVFNLPPNTLDLLLPNRLRYINFKKDKDQIEISEKNTTVFNTIFTIINNISPPYKFFLSSILNTSLDIKPLVLSKVTKTQLLKNVEMLRDIYMNSKIMKVKQNDIDMYPSIDVIFIKNLSNSKFEKELNFKNDSFILDSTYLVNKKNSEHRYHAIAGITCKNKPYLYNGWNFLSKDPSYNMNFTPNKHYAEACHLFPYDWKQYKDHDFCIDTKHCNFPDYVEYLDNKVKKNLCFNLTDNNRQALIYIKSTYADPKYKVYNQNLITPQTKSKSLHSAIKEINKAKPTTKLNKEPVPAPVSPPNKTKPVSPPSNKGKQPMDCSKLNKQIEERKTEKGKNTIRDKCNERSNHPTKPCKVINDKCVSIDNKKTTTTPKKSTTPPKKSTTPPKKSTTPPKKSTTPPPKKGRQPMDCSKLNEQIEEKKTQKGKTTARAKCNERSNHPTKPCKVINDKCVAI